MVSKETRVFLVDGKQVRFDKQSFNKCFDAYMSAEPVRIGELEQLIADAVHVSRDAVHNWRFDKNGPGDVKIIKEIANQLGITDWTLLIKEIDGGNKMNLLTDRQKEAAKRIYDSCVCFLNEFSNTDGFNNYWTEFSDVSPTNRERYIYERVEKKYNRVILVLDQEYFDLHGHEIYDKFCRFVYETLMRTYDGKLSYAYRFEAIPDGHPTTSEDYCKAMKALNAIVDKIM